VAAASGLIGLEKSVRYSAFAPIADSDDFRHTAGTSWPGPQPDALCCQTQLELRPGRWAAGIWACFALARGLPLCPDVDGVGGVDDGGLLLGGALDGGADDAGVVVGSSGAVVLLPSPVSLEVAEHPASAAASATEATSTVSRSRADMGRLLTVVGCVRTSL